MARNETDIIANLSKYIKTDEPNPYLKTIVSAGDITPKYPSAGELPRFDLTKASPYDTSIIDFGAVAKKGTKPQGENAFWTLLNVLGSTSGVVTNQIANWTDKKLDWKDIPTAETGKIAVTGQLNAWKDGVFDLNDIPLIGGLASIGREAKTGSAIVENLGLKDTKGKIDATEVLGFGLDVALDPLTYFTFGAASTLKQGLKASKEAAKVISKNLADEGIQLAGEITGKARSIVDNTRNSVFDATDFKLKDDYAKQQGFNNFDELTQNVDISNPSIVDDIRKITEQATYKADEAANFVDNAGKAARAANQNNFINLDVPFTTISKGFGSKPKAWLKLEKKIGATGRTAIVNQFRRLGINDQTEIDGVIKKLYDVDNLENMNLQQVRHFAQTLSKLNSNIYDEAVNLLNKSNLSPSAINAVQEVLIRTRRSTGIGNDIGALLRDPEKGVSTAALNLSDSDALNVLQTTLSDLESFLPGITNGRVNTMANDVINELTQLGNLNLSKVTIETPNIIRNVLSRSNVPQDEIDVIISGFSTNIKSNVEDAKTKILQDLQPTIDEVQNIVNNYTKMFQDVMSGESDEIIKQYQNQLDNLNEILKDPKKGFQQLIKDNNSMFAVTSEFSIAVEKLSKQYESIWEGRASFNGTNEQYINETYNFFNDVRKEISDYYGFREFDIIPAPMKDMVKTEELFFNVKNTLQDLDILAKLGFSKGKLNDLKIQITHERLKTPKGGYALAWYEDTNIEIKVGKEGRFSFIHEFMHYLDNKLRKEAGLTYRQGVNYYDEKSSIPFATLPENTKGYKDFKPAHPLFDYAQKIRNATTAYNNPYWKTQFSRLSKNQVYYESNTENIARFFEQNVISMYNRNSDKLLSFSKLDEYASQHMANYKSTRAYIDKINVSDSEADKLFEELYNMFKANNLVTPKNIIEDDLLQKGYTPAGTVEDVTKQIESVTKKMDDYKQATNRIQKQLIDTNKFQQDMVIRRMTKSKYFNPESLGSADDFVDSYGKLITRSNSIVYGEKIRMQKDLRMMEQLIKGLTQDELATIPYLLEKKYPGGMTKEQFLSSRNVSGDVVARLDDITSKMENIYEKLGILELEVGAMTRLRQDYFPHVYKIPDADAAEQLDDLLKQFPDDEFIKELAGRSKNLGFDKTRKSFQTLADLDDHIARLDQKIAEATTDAEKAQLMLRKKRIQDIYERNPINALARRYAKSIRSRVNTELYSEFEKASLLIRKDSRALIDYDQKAFHKLDKAEARALGLQEGDLMHKEVFEGLKKVDGLFKDEGLNKIINEVDSVVSIWKQVLTSLVPKYYFYNFIGNIYNNSLAGVSISSYKQAGDIMKRIRTKEVTTADKQFLDQAIKDGVINQGFLSDMSQYYGDLANVNPPTVGQKIERTLGEKLKNIPVVGTEKLSYKRGLEAVGEFTDDFTRLANYIDALNKTGSREIASAQVRKYLFNYRELSVGDRYIRQFIPFWSWIRNNIPLQLNKLLTEPRHALTWYKIKEQTQGEITESDVPRWILESSFFIGNKAIDPRLPISDLNQIIRTDPDGFLREILSMSNPLLKNMIELSLNKKFFNERPINYGDTPVEDYTTYFLQQFGQYGSSTSNILFKENVSVPEELAKLFLPVPREVQGR